MSVIEFINLYSWLFPVFSIIYGLIIGSFLNVLIYRLPIIIDNELYREYQPNMEYHEPIFNLSIPKSSCPKCKAKIRIIDNIPVISWLNLKGRCYNCREYISVRYPIVELLTASMCFIVAINFPFSLYSIAIFIFTFILISLSFIDFDTMLLPDKLTQPLLWYGIILSLFNISPITIEDSIIGAIFGYLILWTVFWISRFLFKKEGIGYGDFKLLAALGAFSGWQSIPHIILLSSILGFVYGICHRCNSKKITNEFPFGPCLSIAGWTGVVFGFDISKYLVIFFKIPVAFA